MKTNALSIANYFVKKHTQTNDPLDLIRLIKYVYISYGFTLAILDKCILDYRFDKVEAWKYGPVIPIVYHSFKHFRKEPITKEAEIMEYDKDSGEIKFTIPTLDEGANKNICTILDFVWDKYKKFTSNELIDILHQKGTPWKYCYSELDNNEIPEEMTKAYYLEFIKTLINN